MQISKQIPPAIITAATAILQPYFPDLSAAGLVEALKPRTETETGPRFFTRYEVAAMFKVNPATVDNWIKSGQLQAVKTGPRAVRIPVDSVKNFSRK